MHLSPDAAAIPAMSSKASDNDAFSAFDHRCMAAALRAAGRGVYGTDPNPRVGCVIARDGRVLATGWHRAAGGPHAEVLALAEAGDDARGATAYVTLEPCSHYGRTPPCVDALLEAGIAEVVVATRDPNPAVNGTGLDRLAALGVRCRSGLLAEQAEALNPGFFKRMRHGRPWVRVKLAQSLDGRIALHNGVSQWITGPAARRDVQRWRARSSAILTGIGTVLADDPSLNVRPASGEAKDPAWGLIGQEPRQPLRVIVDSRWRTPPDARTLGLPGEVLVAGLAKHDIPPALAASGAGIVGLPESDGRVSLDALLGTLAEREINEVHVEAGGALCGALLEGRLIDELLVYQAPCVLGQEGQASFALPRLDGMEGRPSLAWSERRMVGDDLRMRLRPQYRTDVHGNR
jgi:diaminohydroxyphosphoribosylaminopyrimidine deaminase/5-amino-6-(5-phosphoribosylamino)uracil reductase